VTDLDCVLARESEADQLAVAAEARARAAREGNIEVRKLPEQRDLVLREVGIVHLQKLWLRTSFWRVTVPKKLNFVENFVDIAF
jgi:hypothetical protein